MGCNAMHCNVSNVMQCYVVMYVMQCSVMECNVMEWKGGQCSALGSSTLAKRFWVDRTGFQR